MCPFLTKKSGAVFIINVWPSFTKKFEADLCVNSTYETRASVSKLLKDLQWETLETRRRQQRLECGVGSYPISDTMLVMVIVFELHVKQQREQHVHQQFRIPFTTP